MYYFRNYKVQETAWATAERIWHFFVGEALHILKDICIRKPPADSSNNLIWNDRLYFLRKNRMNNGLIKPCDKQR